MEELNPNVKKTRVAIYIRVSTTEQKIDGYGLEAQKTRLLEYVHGNKSLNFETKNGWIFSDAHTGSDLNRPALNELRKAVKEKKVDAVLVWKIDRLSRSLKHLLNLFEEFKENGASFISVQENLDFRGPIGALVFGIFGSIAQFERELIKGRTQMGKIASAEMGNYTGTSVPYGYTEVANPGGKGKRLNIILDEKKWVEKIYEWYIFDQLGFGQIAKKLNQLKIPKGRHAKNKHSKWTQSIVTNILQNPIYRGAFIANKKDDSGIMLPEAKWTIVAVPPCVSELTFEQAKSVCEGKTGGKTNEIYLLTGKLRDMTLTTPKTFVGAKRSKGGYSYRRKQFDKDGQHYPVFEIPAKQIEEFVWGKILKALKDPEVFIKNYLSKKYTDPERIQELERQLNALREKKINIELAIARIEEAYETGSYSEEKMNEKVSGNNEEIEHCEQKIQEIEDELKMVSAIDIEVKKLKQASAQIKYRLEHLSQKHKKVIVRLFVNKVEMYRTKENDRWQTSADVYFRFNPDKFPNTITEGCTPKGLETKGNDKKTSDKGDLGGRGET